MAIAKTLVEQLGEVKAANTLGRVSLVELYSVYGESFNRERVKSYFVKIPDCVKWRDTATKDGRYTFFIEGVGSYFRPATISAFIDIMESIGEPLEVNCDEYIIEKTRWFL
jgi:hypothetical protein